MCGIFGYIGTNNQAGNIILDGLKSLEYRGYDSWGIAIKNPEGTVIVEKHTGKIGDATMPAIASTIGIGHTRWATHGGVTDVNSHPHVSCDKKVVVVHNGIVENFAELKNDLLKKGHTFLSETDTEVLVHFIEEKLKTRTDIKEIMLEVFQEVKGMNAIIAFFPEQEAFYAIKNGSPLVLGKTDKELLIASDASAIAPYTNSVYFMHDNELIEINRTGFQLFDESCMPKEMEFTTLHYSYEAVQLGNYPHYMIKEIHEQPNVLQHIIDTQVESLTQAVAFIKESQGTYLIGCGTAYYACLAGTYFFSKIAHLQVLASAASEFTYLEDFLTNKSLIMPLSQSGETIDIISSLKKAKEKHTKILAITNTVSSTLYRTADKNILLNAGPEKAVCSTKAYIAKIAILYMLAHIVQGTTEEGTKHIQQSIASIKHLLKHEESIQQLAERIKDQSHMFILGRGISYTAALEASLKIKEVSYIHAEGFAAGELKHGVIALIERGTPVIVFNPTDETYEDTLSAAHEVKARGAHIIGVSSIHNPIYDDYIQVENSDDATIMTNVVVAQLLGYYLAVSKGFDPDKPRNLAKSVTVK